MQNTRLLTVTNTNTESFKCSTRLRHKNVLVKAACNGRDQLLSESDRTRLSQNSAHLQSASLWPVGGSGVLGRALKLTPHPIVSKATREICARLDRKFNFECSLYALQHQSPRIYQSPEAAEKSDQKVRDISPGLCRPNPGNQTALLLQFANWGDHLQYCNVLLYCDTTTPHETTALSSAEISNFHCKDILRGHTQTLVLGRGYPPQTAPPHPKPIQLTSNLRTAGFASIHNTMFNTNYRLLHRVTDI